MTRKEEIKQELISTLDSLLEQWEKSDKISKEARIPWDLNEDEDLSLTSNTLVSGAVWAWKNRNYINEDLVSSDACILTVKAYKALKENERTKGKWLDRIIDGAVNTIFSSEKFQAVVEASK